MSKKMINEFIKRMTCLHEYRYRFKEIGTQIYQVKECQKCGKIKKEMKLIISFFIFSLN